MIIHVWLVLVVLGLICTGLTLVTLSDDMALLFGTISFVLWSVVAYGALDLEVIDDQGATQIHAEPAIAVLAIGAAFLPVVLLVSVALYSLIAD